MDQLKQHAEVISLSMTVAIFYLAAVVIKHYCPSLKRLFTDGRMAANLCLMAGITLTSSSTLTDHIYWALAWGSSLFGMAAQDGLFRNGVYSNIPFRHLLTGWGLYLHLVAKDLTNQKQFWVARRHLKVAVTVALITFGILTYLT